MCNTPPQGDRRWMLLGAELLRDASVASWRLGRLEEADAFAARATAKIDKLLSDDPTDATLQLEQIHCLHVRVVTRFKMESPIEITSELRDNFSKEETIQLYRCVLDAASDWVDREPRSVEARINHFRVGQLAPFLLSEDDAERTMLRSADLLTALRDEFPELTPHYARRINSGGSTLPPF